MQKHLIPHGPHTYITALTTYKTIHLWKREAHAINNGWVTRHTEPIFTMILWLISPVRYCHIISFVYLDSHNQTITWCLHTFIPSNGVYLFISLFSHLKSIYIPSCVFMWQVVLSCQQSCEMNHSYSINKNKDQCNWREPENWLYLNPCGIIWRGGGGVSNEGHSV